MNKTELIESLASRLESSKAEAQRAVDALFDTETGIISRTLDGGDRVQITGFGTFEARERKARPGRNPRTGERLRIPASRAVTFRAGKGLKEALN